MYILVNYIRSGNGKRCTMSYESFQELKQCVVNILNGRGWDNADTVDLRSIDSCVRYLFSDHRAIKYKKSMSYDKYIDYRFGKKGMHP